MKKMLIPLVVMGSICMAVAAWQWDKWVTVPKLRVGLERSLKDPASAIYEDLVIGSSGTALCGRVNAKNGYGAFTGFMRFISTPDRHAEEGTALASWGEQTTDEVVEDLDVAVKFLLRTPGASREDAVAHAKLVRFDQLWARHCAG